MITCARCTDVIDANDGLQQEDYDLCALCKDILHAESSQRHVALMSKLQDKTKGRDAVDAAHRELERFEERHIGERRKNYFHAMTFRWFRGLLDQRSYEDRREPEKEPIRHLVLTMLYFALVGIVGWIALWAWYGNS